MIDRLFLLVLTFSLLAGGTVAIGSELLVPHPSLRAQTSVAQLPRVVVTAKKQPVVTEVARAANEASVKRVE